MPLDKAGVSRLLILRALIRALDYTCPWQFLKKGGLMKVFLSGEG